MTLDTYQSPYWPDPLPLLDIYAGYNPPYERLTYLIREEDTYLVTLRFTFHRLGLDHSVLSDGDLLYGDREILCTGEFSIWAERGNYRSSLGDFSEGVEFAIYCDCVCNISPDLDWIGSINVEQSEEGYTVSWSSGIRSHRGFPAYPGYFSEEEFRLSGRV